MAQPGHHLAVAIGEGGRIAMVEVRTPRLGPEQVLAGPVVAGLCGTDLGIVRGQRADEARILGHEGVVEIKDIGSHRSDHHVGDLLALNPVDPRDQKNIVGHSRDGLFQECIVLFKEELARSLPISQADEVPFLCGPLIEPLATIVYGHALLTSTIQPDTVAIIGGGPIGLLNAIHWKSILDCRVVVIHNSKARLEWAIEKGILETNEVSPTLGDPSEINWAELQDFDCALVCTSRRSSREAFQLATRIVRRNGYIDLFTGFPDHVNFPGAPQVRPNDVRRSNVCGSPSPGNIEQFVLPGGKPVWVTGHRGTSPSHLRTAASLLSQNPTKYTRVISHIVSPKALAALLENYRRTGLRRIGGEEWVKVVIDYSLAGTMVLKPPSEYLLHNFIGS